MVRYAEIQPVTETHGEGNGWTQCSERDATGFYVSVERDHRRDAQFNTRREAAEYMRSLTW